MVNVTGTFANLKPDIWNSSLTKKLLLKDTREEIYTKFTRNPTEVMFPKEAIQAVIFLCVQVKKESFVKSRHFTYTVTLVVLRRNFFFNF